VMRGLKLLTQAKAYDKSYQVTIDRMRARRRRRSMTVQVAAEKKVTPAVTAKAKEPGGQSGLGAGLKANCADSSRRAGTWGAREAVAGWGRPGKPPSRNACG
jgi:hypothetical protein